MKNGKSLSASIAAQPDAGALLLFVWQQMAAPFIAQRDRWALLVPVPMAGGIALWFALPQQPDWWLAGFFLVTSFAIWRVLSRTDIWRVPALLLVWATLGFAAAEFRGWNVDAPVLAKQMRFAKLEGSIDSVHPRKGGVQVILSDLLIAGLQAKDTPGRVRLTIRGEQTGWQPGDRVRVNARLFPPPRPVMPGAWDYGRQLWFDRINATGFSFGAGELVNRPGAGNLRAHIASLRQKLTMALLQAFETEGADHGNLAVALITGERGLLPDDLRDDMRAAGLAHLLAISGLHIGLVSGMVYLAARAILALVPAIALKWPIRKWAAIGGWLMALLYWQISGATIPTERAFIMVSVFFLAILLDRQALSMRNVMIAAVLVLAFRPEALLNAGFHLSFAATSALIAVAEIWQMRRQKRDQDSSVFIRLGKHGLLYAAGVASTSIVAGLATGPLSAWHFGQVAHYGLLANMLAVPLVALAVMPLSILVVLLLPFGLASWPLMGLDYALSLVLDSAAAISSLPGASGRVGVMAPAAIWFYAIAMLMFVTWRHKLRLWSVPFMMGCILCLFLQPPMKPSLIVSEDGKTVLLRTKPPVSIDQGRRDTWLLDRWGQAFGWYEHEIGVLGKTGDTDETLISDKAENSPASWRCDNRGCSGHISGYRVAVAKHGTALNLDCRKADILIATIPVRQACQHPIVVIDRFDLWRYGSHSITFTPAPEIGRATDISVNRRWRPQIHEDRAPKYSNIEKD